MKKVCLFIFGLLILVTVGCATNPKAGYVVEIPEEALNTIMALVAFVDVGAKRGMIDYNDPDILEIQHHVQIYATYAYWDREWAKKKELEYITKYKNMTDTEFAAEVQEFNKAIPHIKQITERAARISVQKTQLANQRRNIQGQVNQSQQATQIQIPNFQAPNVQVPTPSLNINPLGNPSTGYMINTDQGLEHGNCTTLPSGMVYCQ